MPPIALFRFCFDEAQGDVLSAFRLVHSKLDHQDQVLAAMRTRFSSVSLHTGNSSDHHRTHAVGCALFASVNFSETLAFKALEKMAMSGDAFLTCAQALEKRCAYALGEGSGVEDVVVVPLDSSSSSSSSSSLSSLKSPLDLLRDMAEVIGDLNKGVAEAIASKRASYFSNTPNGGEGFVKIDPRFLLFEFASPYMMR